MIRRPFFSLLRPKLKHLAVVQEAEQIRPVPLPGRVSILVKGCDIGQIKLKVGVSVKTAEKLRLTDDPDGYVLSTVTGTIAGITEYTGYLGQDYVCIAIDVAGEDQWDADTLEALKAPTFEAGRDYLKSIVGKSDFSSFLRQQPPVNTVVITGMDQDLMVLTNRFMVQSGVGVLAEGIEYLKKVARVGRVVMVVPPDLASYAEQAGVEVRLIEPVYPKTLPAMIAKGVLAGGYRAGKSFEQMGLGFISAEAVICLAGIFGKAAFDFDKVITVIGKDNIPAVVKARIGTPVKTVLDSMGIDTVHGDRLILGGPMTGRAIYSEDTAVEADTDAIMVQDGPQVALTTDGQCVNCGECVRLCPARVPVNMLVRVLSAGHYEEAAESYDLFSCIDCGLCSYVCVAHLPVFHHIMLGKHEFFRIKNAEGSNA